MGLTNETKATGAGGNSITLRGGLFTLNSKEGVEGAIPRKITSGKRDGDTVYELKYKSLSGMIVGLALPDSQRSGKDGIIQMMDFKTGEEFTVKVFGDSGMFTDFIKCLPNIDTSKEVWLQMNAKSNGGLDANGNPLTNLKILQDGKVIPNYYSEWDQKKVNPKTQKRGMYITLHGMPEWEETPKGWNHDDQDYFLWDRFEEYIATFEPPTLDPDFAHGAGEADRPKIPTEADVPEEESDVPEEESDDIPF